MVSAHHCFCFYFLQLLLLLVLVNGALGSGNKPQGLVAFPFDNIDPSSPVALDWTLDASPITVNSAAITAKNGHFYRGNERIRFWGVNLCFGAVFPEHAVATRMAARMRQVGVNVVRIHHGDAYTFPTGIWANATAVSSASLDRLAFLIAELAAQGIYTNLNLHVDKAWSAVLNLPNADLVDDGGQDKFVPFLNRAVREKHKWYATQMLTYRNPYRSNTRLADDPALAIVELTNENSLFMWGSEATLSSLPTWWNDNLNANYSQFLLNKYGSESGLRSAWAPPYSGQCNGGLSDTDCSAPSASSPANVITVTNMSLWYLETHSPATATKTPIANGGVRIQVTTISDVDWYLQLNTAQLPIVQNTTYAVVFYARVISGTTQLGLALSQAGGTYSSLGIGASFTLTNSWKKYYAFGMAPSSYSNARVSFSFASTLSTFEIQNVSLIYSSCDLFNTNLNNWNSWNLAVYGTAAATKTLTNGVTTVTTTTIDDYSYHVDLNLPKIKVTAGTSYSLLMDCKGTGKASFSVCINYSPWTCWGSESKVLTSTWSTCGVTFTAPQNERNAVVHISTGYQTGTFSFKNVSLAVGGCVGLLSTETISTVPVYPSLPGETHRRYLDKWLFFYSLEKTYFDDMHSHVKQTLGYTGTVTGTINFGPLNLAAQSSMEFIDYHSYWQHPSFPNKPWDPVDWLINQKSMAENPGSATFWNMVKIDGRPATITEYNHPAPNDYQAETVPMIAGYIATQDFDGLFMFAYAHGLHETNAQQHRITSFFDIDYNPAKWCFMKIGALVFRNSLIPVNSQKKVISMSSASTSSAILDAFAEIPFDGAAEIAQRTWAGSSWKDFLVNRMTMKTGLWTTTTESVPADSSPVIRWNSTWGFEISSNKAILFAGRTNTTKQFTWGTIAFSKPSFVSLAVAALDGKSFSTTTDMLIVAMGRCENTNMNFTDDRRSVGKSWGNTPVLVEVVSGTLTLNNVGKSQQPCWLAPLNSSGMPNGHNYSLVISADGSLVLDLPQTTDATVWWHLHCESRGSDSASAALVPIFILFLLSISFLLLQ